MSDYVRMVRRGARALWLVEGALVAAGRLRALREARDEGFAGAFREFGRGRNRQFGTAISALLLAGAMSTLANRQVLGPLGHGARQLYAEIAARRA